MKALGLKHMLKDMGRLVDIEVLTDSSAAKGIVHRVGAGKVEHVEAKPLWIQEYVENKTVKVSKVPREHNCSDTLTHHWNAVDGRRHFQSMGLTRIGTKD